MDLDERIEEFRNSLPEKKREAFDSLPHDYKQTLIDPEAIKKMAQASLDAAGVMKRTPAKLPSFPAPFSLPGSFLDELDEHPVATFIQIKKEFNKEFSAWVAGCCQYLGSFIELNSGNCYVNLTQCHLNKRNIEACAKLLYLSGVMLDDKHSMNYFIRIAREITRSFYPLDTSSIPADISDLDDLTKHLEREYKRQHPEHWFEDWRQRVAHELQELFNKKDLVEKTALTNQRKPQYQPAAPAKKVQPEKKRNEKGCLGVCLILTTLAALGIAFLH